MTPLPSRLRASAQELRELPRIDDGWAREVNSPVAARIARELEEAAQALEAGRGEPVAWRVRGHAFDFNTDEPRLWHYYTGSRRPAVGVPYRCDIEPLYAAPAAQVAQEGGGGKDTKLRTPRMLTSEELAECCGGCRTNSAIETWMQRAIAKFCEVNGITFPRGVPASEYLAKIKADPRRAAALQRARDRTAGVATDGGRDA